MVNKELTEALMYYYDHPYEFVCDLILDSANTKNYPSKQQERFLKALVTSKKTRFSIKSGHGTGKTAMLSWVIIWFMTTRPYCRIPCTAPTQPQLYDILWSEVAKWIKRIKDPRLKNSFEWTATHISNKWEKETWFAVARSSNKPENMQGFHGDNLLFIIDEASGVEQNIFEVINGALSTEGALCIMTGNPTQLSGTFYDSHTKSKEYWETFTFSCLDSERVSQEYIDMMANDYGEDSNVYKIRVLGEFPVEEDDTIIPYSWAEQASNNEFDVEDRNADVHIGVDVARYGDDKTEICVRQENKVINWKTYSKKSTMETVGNIMLIVKEYDNNDVYINVDDTGVGGGVTDRLEELMGDNPNVTINGVNNGSKPYDEEAFRNRGAELWWNLRLKIRDIQIPKNDRLVAQLATRKYKLLSNGKIELEKKDDMKKRGLKSPDKADALTLAFIDEEEESGGLYI